MSSVLVAIVLFLAALPQEGLPALPPATPAAADRVAEPEYRIEPHDLLSVAVLQAPELNTSARVAENGAISLPLLGIVQVAGMTVAELEAELERRLRQQYVREPDVTVQATETQSQAVSVLGAVGKPGVVQVRGAKGLLEVLSLAGGLAEDAGETIVVLREGRAIEVSLSAVRGADEAALNIPIRPGDVVTVRSAEIVYVVGEINKPGAFPMRPRERLTVLRALALSGGLTATAARGDAIVLRANAAGERVEIPVDLGKVLKGSEPDIVLQGQDVLFVPTSGSKAAMRATLNALLRTVRPF